MISENINVPEKILLLENIFPLKNENENINLIFQFNSTGSFPFVNVIYNKDNILSFYFPYSLQLILNSEYVKFDYSNDYSTRVNDTFMTFKNNLTFNELYNTINNIPISIVNNNYCQKPIKNELEFEKWEFTDFWNQSTVKYNSNITTAVINESQKEQQTVRIYIFIYL